MNRLILSICLMALSAGVVFGVAENFWANRNSPDGAKANYDFCKEEYSKARNYETAWKLARAAEFYGDNYSTNMAMKLGLFTEGKNLSETATNLAPDKVEGHYYLAVCLGLWGEANGIFQSLFAVPGILGEATKTIEIDPAYKDAGGYMIRARLYQKAPGGISVGDVKKSQEDYEMVLKLAPKNRTACRFYAELLLDTGQKARAKEVIEKGLAIPLDATDAIIETKETGILKELQKKL